MSRLTSSLALTICMYAVAADAASRATGEKPPVVLPSGQKMSGVTNYDLAVTKYLGIKFAEAPVGDRRWRSPVAVAPGSAKSPVFEAKSFGPNCMQSTEGGPAWATLGDKFSEDCLYLNVFTPDRNEAEKDLLYPVMVFVHGGGYAYGGSYDTELDGATLAGFTDCVVVTLQYRVDAFGFLGSETLRQEGGEAHNSTGNWGIQDQRMALKWVKENIHAFGGNRSHTMLFGESAGAGSVSNHVAMPRSWGLFTSAMMQSGGFQRWVAKPMDEAQRNYKKLVQRAGCGDESKAHEVACLRKLNASELLRWSAGTRMPYSDSWDSCQWAPVIDGVELDAHPGARLRAGKVAPRVPLALGTNKDEGVSFISYNKTGAEQPVPTVHMTKEQFHDWVARIFGEAALGRVLELYPVAANGTVARPAGASSGVGNNAAAAYRDYWEAATFIAGDYMMTCPNRRFARWHASNHVNHGGSEAFLYMFSEMPGFKPSRQGAFHGAEVRFVFLDIWELAGWEEKDISSRMVRFWSNFAATGNPNVRFATADHKKAPVPCQTWPAYKELNGTNMHFELPESHPETELRQQECDFWDTQPY